MSKEETQQERVHRQSNVVVPLIPKQPGPLRRPTVKELLFGRKEDK